jgi:hypothetical protein
LNFGVGIGNKNIESHGVWLNKQKDGSWLKNEVPGAETLTNFVRLDAICNHLTTVIIDSVYRHFALLVNQDFDAFTI